MALVTIGVPVFNGAAFLAECLECLIGQTFSDIEILVFDNASTDATPAIVERFARRDHRIKYVRRLENIGAIGNFLAPLEQAASPYFMWRAHDDLSSPDYVETLVAALQLNPQACLAAGTVESIRMSTGRRKVREPHMPGRSLRVIEIARLMFGSHAGWYYGLWRTQALRPLVTRVWLEYPHAWASDHLTLYPVLLDRAVAAAPQARFVQRMIRKDYTQPLSHRVPLAQLLGLRAGFWKACGGFLAEREFGLTGRLLLNLATFFYLGRRVYRLGTVAQSWLAAMLSKRAPALPLDVQHLTTA